MINWIEVGDVLTDNMLDSKHYYRVINISDGNYTLKNAAAEVDETKVITEKDFLQEGEKYEHGNFKFVKISNKNS